MKKSALLSVFDKTGIVEFARGLIARDFQILATDGTAKELAKNGVEYVEVSKWTGMNEAKGGLVKTLNDKIYKSILLGDGDLALVDEDIDPIKLVVCNLYPFEARPSIETIDIGGPTMLFAATKAWKMHGQVVPVSNPKDYDAVLKALDENQSAYVVDRNIGNKLAANAFASTAYDRALVADFLMKGAGEKFPEKMVIPLKNSGIEIRYAENPHQQGAAYINPLEAETGGILQGKQLHGKALSYNNILDSDAALRLPRILQEASNDKPICAIIKHNNPCGAAIGKDLLEAYDKAFIADPISAFGGIIATNCIFDEETAEKMVLKNKHFVECIIAPGYSDAALKIIETKPNVRVLKSAAPKFYQRFSMKSIVGGMLVQDYNNTFFWNDPEEKIPLGVRAGCRPVNYAEMQGIKFNWPICCMTKSNTITLSIDQQLIGVGTGQQNRIDCVKLAIERAERMVQQNTLPRSGALVMGSDSFFPVNDCVPVFAEWIAKLESQGYEFTGKAIAYFGGSIKDQESIDTAIKNNITMFHTGVRGFCH